MTWNHGESRQQYSGADKEQAYDVNIMWGKRSTRHGNDIEEQCAAHIRQTGHNGGGVRIREVEGMLEVVG